LVRQRLFRARANERVRLLAALFLRTKIVAITSASQSDARPAPATAQGAGKPMFRARASERSA
jgi:hypothetical protein